MIRATAHQHRQEKRNHVPITMMRSTQLNNEMLNELIEVVNAC